MKSSEDSFYLHCPTFLLIKTLQSPSSRTKLYSFHCTCMMDVNKIQKYSTAVKCNLCPLCWPFYRSLHYLQCLVDMCVWSNWMWCTGEFTCLCELMWCPRQRWTFDVSTLEIFALFFLALCTHHTALWGVFPGSWITQLCCVGVQTQFYTTLSIWFVVG